MKQFSNGPVIFVVAGLCLGPIVAFIVLPLLFRHGGACDSLQCRFSAVFVLQAGLIALIGVWLRRSARHVPVWDASNEPATDCLPEQRRQFQQRIISRLYPKVFGRLVQDTGNGVILHGLVGSRRPASFFFVLRDFVGRADAAPYFMRDLHGALVRALVPSGNLGDRLVYLVICGQKRDLDRHSEQFHAEFVKRVMTFRCVHLVDVDTGRTELKMSRWGALEFGPQAQEIQAVVDSDARTAFQSEAGEAEAIRAPLPA